MEKSVKGSNKSGYVNSRLVLALDTCISTIASLFAILIARWATSPILHFSSYVLIWLAAALVSSIIGFFLFGSYKVILSHATLKSVRKLTNAVIIKEVLLTAALLIRLYQPWSMKMAVVLILMDWLISSLALILTRVSIVSIVQEGSRDPGNVVGKTRILVYGTSNKSVALLTRFEESRNYTIAGILSEDVSMNGRIIQDTRIYCFDSEDSLKKICIKVGGADAVMFANDIDTVSQQDKLVKYALGIGLHVLTAPKVNEVYLTGVTREALDEVRRANDFIPDAMSAFERSLKRIVDCALSLVLMVFFAPMFIACHIAIKKEDGGPSIYKQERIGRFGKPFYIYKFRSMKMDAEAAGPALYAGEDDPRLTKTGKFLRKHHLDELPQLWNVFRGEMAFIGWRPERRYYIDQIIKVDPRFVYLYQIRPGVTSYSTLYNGYTDTLEKMLRRLEFELYYLNHRSWWMDVKILWRTFTNIAFGKVF